MGGELAPPCSSAALSRAAPARCLAAHRYVNALVKAADEVGAGACVSIVVVDTDGKPLESVQVHTGTGGLVEPPKPSPLPTGAIDTVFT